MPSLSYRYRSPSVLANREGYSLLALSAEVGGSFFQGRIRQPRQTARALICLSRVIADRWFDAAAAADARRRMQDPIITSESGRLRFEGFSACRSLYVRVDLMPDAFEAILQTAGTTNVDFNAPLRAALARINECDALSLAVDNEAFMLVHGAEVLLERKVDLPVSWFRGLASIPVIESLCEPVCELSGAALLEFFRSLPRTGNARESHWLHPSAKGIRVARIPGKDAIELTGLKRLLVLQDLLSLAEKLTISCNSAREISLWTLHFPGMRLTLALSPQVWRGFSGEGASLDDLTRFVNADLDAALLSDFEDGFVLADVAVKLGVTVPEIRTALARLASQGQFGYDHVEARWFRRMLPGRQALFRQSNLRLARAEVWVAAGAVAVESHSNAQFRGRVRIDDGTVHHVAIGPEGDRCSCFWHGRFGLSRGPCSHILALRLESAR